MMKKDIPLIPTKHGVLLDTHIVMPHRDVKGILEYSKLHEGFIRFLITRYNRKITVLIGDITKEGDYTDFEPNVQVYKISEDLDIAFNKNLLRILRCIDGDVEIFARSNFPMIIREIENKFGFMITPHLG